MSHKAYPEHKPSGLEWVDSMPAHWDTRKLKHIASVRFSHVDKNTREGEQPVRLSNYVDVYYNDFVTPGLSLMAASATPSEIRQFALEEGDVLITKDSEAWDDIAVPAYACSGLHGVLCGYHLAHIRPDPEQAEGRYLFRAFCSRGINDQFRVAATGVTRYGLGKYWIDNGLFPVPPLDEQRCIVRFLDRETGRIDALVEKKERQIELLQEKRSALISHAVTKGLDPNAPMKDSGIDWLGKIPAHWEVERLKWYTSRIGSGKTPRGGAEVYVADGVVFLRSQNVHFEGLRLDDVVYIDDDTDAEMSGTRAVSGDVLLDITGASLGRCSLVPSAFPKANVNQHVCIIRPRPDKIHRPYLHQALASSFVQSQIFSIENGSSREGLNFLQVANLILAVPPTLAEQEQITGYVGQVVQELDEIMAKNREVIEKLQEYRTALISAAVTGKIDVRDEVT